MNASKRKFTDVLQIFLPSLWACIIDLFMTVNGQSDDYWSGNLSAAKEGNELINYFMINSPYGIFIFTLIWIITFLSIGYFLPDRILQVFALFIMISHTYGAASWMF